MAGSITVSSITLDSDNNFSIKSNTGATLFFANTTGIDIANSIGATAITSDKILSVANTKISGNIASSQIAPNQTLNGNVSVTGTLAVSGGVTLTTTLPVLQGGTGVTTSTGTGAGVHSVGPSISSAVMSTMASSVITSGTAVASTSGTSIDFTSIPSWVKRITVMFNGVSLSSTASILIQIGPSGGVETSSYSGVVLGNGIQNAWGGTGYLITRTGVATSIYSGIVTLANITGSTWICAGTVGDPTNGFAGLTAGTKAITGTLSIVRITSTSTDTFDAGSVNILYE